MAQAKKRRTPRCSKIAAQLEAARKVVQRLEAQLEDATRAEQARADARAAKIKEKHDREQAKLRARHERELKRAGVEAACSPAKPRGRKPGKKASKKGASKRTSKKAEAEDKGRAREAARREAEARDAGYTDPRAVGTDQLQVGDRLLTGQGPARIASVARQDDGRTAVRFVPEAGENKGKEVARMFTATALHIVLPRARRSKGNGTIPLFGDAA